MDIRADLDIVGQVEVRVVQFGLVRNRVGLRYRPLAPEQHEDDL
jgi:hypothetical protein